MLWSLRVAKLENLRRERPLPVRIGKRGFGVRIKGDLRIEFGHERLTSHAGLELFRRYLRTGGLAAHLRRSEQRLPRRGDFRFVPLVLLVVAMRLAAPP